MVDLLEVDGAAGWQECLSQLPDPDVYFRHSYHHLHELHGDGVARATVVRRGAETLFIPALKCAISSSVPAVAGFDLQTCNGYGGPLCSPEASVPFIAEAWRQFARAAKEHGIVAALFRLHPLLANEQWLPVQARVAPQRSTVYIDLGDGPEAAWRNADSRHRNMVSKAHRSGALVTWNPPGGWAQFVPLYATAMSRLNASNSLRYGEPYFTALAAMPEAELAVVSDDRGVLGMAAFLWGPRFGHYHLSARGEGAPNYVSNLLLQAGLERAATRGLAGVHLGGGTTNSAADPLLRFKRSLGGRLLDFKVALVVTDDAAFEHLNAVWSKEAGRAPTWLLGYRQPLTSGSP